MTGQIPFGKPVNNLPPADVEGFDSLVELALDLRWSWNHAAYTARVIPRFEGLAVPLEDARILWAGGD